jgi:hypothetical protein
MNIFKAKRLWRKAEMLRRPPPEVGEFGACVNFVTMMTRWTLTRPGLMRLILPPLANTDPLLEWKKWAARVTTRLNHRLPGNWKTRRGIKKRKKALWRLY